MLLAAHVGGAITRADEPPRTTTTTYALSWVRAPGLSHCPDAARVAGATEQRLARPVFVAPRDASVLIEAHVARSADTALALEMRMSTRQGEALGTRALEVPNTPDCAELLRAATLALAVLIDPQAAIGASAPSAPPIPPPPAPRRDVLDPELAPPRSPPKGPAPRRLVLGVDAGASFWRGVAPRSAFGPQVRALVGREVLGHVEAAVTVLVARANPGPEGGGVLGDAVMMTLGVCPQLLTLGPVTWLACVAHDAGLLRAAGYGYERDVVRTLGYAAVSAGTALEGRVVGPLVLRASASGGLAYLRPTLDARLSDGTEAQLFRAHRFPLQAGLSLGVRFF